MLKVVKTNGKYNSYPDFLYNITVEYGRRSPSRNESIIMKQDWFAVREWCWETWGPSKELEDWLIDRQLAINEMDKLVGHNVHWCWQNNQYASRIYLATDKELNWFKLRWQ